MADFLLVHRRRTAIVAAAQRGFDEADDKFAAVGKIGGFEQRLLFVRLERAHHRQRGNQPIIGGLLDGILIRLDIFHLEIGA